LINDAWHDCLLSDQVSVRDLVGSLDKGHQHTLQQSDERPPHEYMHQLLQRVEERMQALDSEEQSGCGIFARANCHLVSAGHLQRLHFNEFYELILELIRLQPQPVRDVQPVKYDVDLDKDVQHELDQRSRHIEQLDDIGVLTSLANLQHDDEMVQLKQQRLVQTEGGHSDLTLLQKELETYHDYSQEMFDEDLKVVGEYIRTTKDGDGRPLYSHLHLCDLVAARIYTKEDVYREFNQAMRGVARCTTQTGAAQEMYTELLRAAKHAHKEFYRRAFKPEGNTGQYCDDLHVFDGNKRVHRPNHGLVNAMRKALLVRPVVSACGGHRKGFEFSEPMLCAMEIAMVFESCGRNSEITFSAHPSRHQEYRRTSIKRLRTYSESISMSGTVLDSIVEGLQGMYRYGLDSPVAQVFELCHELELFRCAPENAMRSRIQRWSQLVGTGTNASKLAMLAEKAIRATGDRLMYSPSGGKETSYDHTKFPLCSNSPRTCLETLISECGYNVIDKPAGSSKVPEQWKCMHYHLQNAVTHLDGARRGEDLFRGQSGLFGDESSIDKWDGGTENAPMFAWPAFTSTSTTKDVAQSFAGTKKGGVLMKICNSHLLSLGARLRGLSEYATEDEVLLPSGASFIATGKMLDVESGRTVVDLKFIGCDIDMTCFTDLVNRSRRQLSVASWATTAVDMHARTSAGATIQSAWRQSRRRHELHQRQQLQTLKNQLQQKLATLHTISTMDGVSVRQLRGLFEREMTELTQMKLARQASPCVIKNLADFVVACRDLGSVEELLEDYTNAEFATLLEQYAELLKDKTKVPGQRQRQKLIQEHAQGLDAKTAAAQSGSMASIGAAAQQKAAAHAAQKGQAAAQKVAAKKAVAPKVAAKKAARKYCKHCWQELNITGNRDRVCPKIWKSDRGDYCIMGKYYSDDALVPGYYDRPEFVDPQTPYCRP
jgi:hypothetical protein